MRRAGEDVNQRAAHNNRNSARKRWFRFFLIIIRVEREKKLIPILFIKFNLLNTKFMIHLGYAVLPRQSAPFGVHVQNLIHIDFALPLTCSSNGIRQQKKTHSHKYIRLFFLFYLSRWNQVWFLPLNQTNIFLDISNAAFAIHFGFPFLLSIFDSITGSLSAIDTCQ